MLPVFKKNCNNSYHQECLAMQGNPANPWRCPECVETSTAKLLSEIRRICEINELLAKSIESCHEKIDENNSLIKAQDFRINEC